VKNDILYVLPAKTWQAVGLLQAIDSSSMEKPQHIQLLKILLVGLQTRRKVQADYKKEEISSVTLDLHTVH
jgi:hypothetical protein